MIQIFRHTTVLSLLILVQLIIEVLSQSNEQVTGSVNVQPNYRYYVFT